MRDDSAQVRRIPLWRAALAGLSPDRTYVARNARFQRSSAGEGVKRATSRDLGQASRTELLCRLELNDGRG
jgi:hypothetical protein